MTRDEAILKLTGNLGIFFSTPDVFGIALVHSSFVNENPGNMIESNERLEFLGDAVLSVAISALLYKRFPTLPEGELTKARARLVNKKMLAALAVELGIREALLLGKGERKNNGADNPTILAGAFEAVLGAVYLDKGNAASLSLIERLFLPHLQSSVAEGAHFDFKPSLQELTQRRFGIAPEYRVIGEEGPAHKKVFTVEVRVGEDLLASAAATTKKDAEQQAAEKALASLKERGIV